MGRMRRRAGMGGTLLGLVLLAACPPKGANMPALATDEFRATGTVSKTAVGVNCWRFEATDGSGYELRPDQAPAEVLADGKRFTLILKKRTDVMSTCMVGPIVDVIRIEPEPAP